MRRRSGNIVNYDILGNNFIEGFRRNRGKGIDKQKYLMYNYFALWKRGTIYW